MKKLILTLLCAAPLAACESAPTQTTLQLQDILRAERGERQTPECLVPADLKGQPHTALKDRKFEVPIRVIFPDSIVTENHIANRLNFKVDKKGTITDISCG